MPPLYHWDVHSFGLTNTELLFIFILSGPKEHDHMILVRFAWSVWTSSSSKFYSLRLPATNTQHVCSGRPFTETWPDMAKKLITHTSTTSRAAGSIHLAKLDIQNNLLSILCSILESGPSGDLCSTVIERSPVLHSYWHVATTFWSLIRTFLAFFGVESHNFFQTFAANANFFSEFSIPNLVEVPRVGDGISGPASEAPGHRLSWHPPRPRLRAKTAQPRPCRSMPPCGAASNLRRFSRGRRPLWLRQTTAEEADDVGRRKLSHSNNKRTMNVLDSTSSKFNAKDPQTHSTSTVTSFLQMTVHLFCRVHLCCRVLSCFPRVPSVISLRSLEQIH